SRRSRRSWRSPQTRGPLRRPWRGLRARPRGVSRSASGPNPMRRFPGSRELHPHWYRPWGVGYRPIRDMAKSRHPTRGPLRAWPVRGPRMGGVEIGDFTALLDPVGQGLLAELSGGAYAEAAALSLASKLRDRYPAPLVATALTQARLRAHAEAKFGSAAATMYFTAQGLEQATRRSVAEWRARRYASAGV